MLLDGVVPAIIVGRVAGGRLGRLKDLDLRVGWIFVVAAAVQVGVMVSGALGWLPATPAGPVLVLLTLLLVLIGLWLNRRLPGVWLVSIGVFLNLLVMVANGGSMPVDRELAVRAGNTRMIAMLDSPARAKHSPVTSSTRLRPLADVLPLPMLWPRPRFFSPGSVGDVLVTAGTCWLILAGMGAFGLRAGSKGRRDAADLC